jgi:uncharacterized membrane protein YeaQ/YmgE (transglycosylase-associated protein family)
MDAERTLIMIMSLPALLVLLVIAAICGAIGRALAGGGGGLVTSIVIGFVGAFLGPLVAHQLKLSEPLMVHVSVSPSRLCGRLSAQLCSWLFFTLLLDGEYSADAPASRGEARLLLGDC